LTAQLEMFDIQGARTTDDDGNVIDGEITIGRHLVISGDADGQTSANYDVTEPDHSASVEALRLKLQIIHKPKRSLKKGSCKLNESVDRR